MYTWNIDSVEWYELKLNKVRKNEGALRAFLKYT